MHMQEYYQICGFQSHTGQWPRFRYDQDHKGLASVIAGHDSPLRSRKDGMTELVLGVQSCGATYLLMTGPQMEAIAKVLNLRPLRNPRSAAQFESLSPIHFGSSEQLASKLLTYGIKCKKGKPHDKDDSQANKSFVFAGGQDGVLRGGFEHQRVFYRISKDEIDLRKFGLSDVSWMRSVRLFSLVFNTWHVDHRPVQERLHHPMLIDIGWTETSVPEYSAKNEAGASVHIVGAGNAKLGQRKAFKHGKTEVLDKTVLSSRVQDMFTKAQECGQPVILLVYGEERTRCALQSFGVDVSRWENGIKSLLGYGLTKNQSGLSRSNDPSSHRRQPRSRSRSPRRERQYGGPAGPSRQDQHSSSPAFRPRSPYRRYQDASSVRLPYDDNDRVRSFAPVYVVDVQQMFVKVSGNGSPGGLNDTARRLGRLREDIPGSCAGNECHLLVDMWLDMAQGPAIDEQRAARWSGAAKSAPAVVAGPANAVESEDPNDFVPALTTAAAAAAIRSAYDDPEDGFEDDSDDD